MNIERLGIRFNLDKEKDRKALEFLQGYDKERYKSLNKFLIEIISEYAENYNIEKEQSDFLERVISTIWNVPIVTTLKGKPPTKAVCPLIIGGLFNSLIVIYQEISRFPNSKKVFLLRCSVAKRPSR